MKILVGIPCLYGYKHTEDAINCCLSQNNVDLLLIDNGGNDEIKTLFKNYACYDRITIIQNEVNVYVNPAWNQILDYFLKTDIEQLVIMNSDLVLQKDWSEVLRYRFSKKSNETLIPTLLNDIKHVGRKVSVTDLDSKNVTSAAGFFITLNKHQAKLVYPVTEDCKVWYGDNWIYEILMGAGHKMQVVNNLLGFHTASQTLQRVAGIHDIIAKDNATWVSTVQPEIFKRIELNKSL